MHDEGPTDGGARFGKRQKAMNVSSESEPQDKTLKALREMTGMTQKQVAERMDVSTVRVVQIEKAFPNLHFTVVSRYMEAIGGGVILDVGSGDPVPLSEMTAHKPKDPEAARKRRERYTTLRNRKSSTDVAAQAS